MNFTEFGFKPTISRALENMGFTTPTPVQEQTIPLVLARKDVAVRSQTGSGKTLAYALPILQSVDPESDHVQTLIVCPTRELCLQVADEIKKIAGFMESVKVVPVYGGSAIIRQIQLLKKRPQIVVGTPGRIMDHLDRKTIKINQLETLVLDEADEMLNMGFKEDIEKILTTVPSTRQTLLFSATYPQAIRHITDQFQTDATKIEIGTENRSLENIEQHYILVGKNNKKEALLEMLTQKNPSLSIVFCNTKAMAEKVAKYLGENQRPSVLLHGDIKQAERKRVIDDVKAGNAKILVASDVAARGLDINNVEYVINYDLPNNVEYFLHRIGRTARAGKNGNAMSIITTKDQFVTLKEFEKQTRSNITEYEISLSEKIKKGTTMNTEEKQPNQNHGEKSNFEKNDRHRTSYSREGRYSREKNGFSKPFSKRTYARKDEESSSTSQSAPRQRRNFSDGNYESEAYAFDKKHSQKTWEGKKEFSGKKFEGRKPFGFKRYGERQETRPFRKPFENKERTSGDGEEKRDFQKRAPRSQDGSRHFNNHGSFEGRTAHHDRYESKSHSERPFGERRNDEKKSFDGKRTSKPKRTYGDKPFGNRDGRSFEHKERSFSSGRSENKPFGTRSEEGNHDGKRSFGKRSYGREDDRKNKSFENRDGRSFEHKERSFSGSRTTGRKPFGTKPRSFENRTPRPRNPRENKPSNDETL